MKYKIVFILIFSIILSGCANQLPNTEIEVATTSTINIEYPDVAIENLQLDEWLGQYSFFESWAHAIQEDLYNIMVYEIFIYKENDKYYADITIDGHLTMGKMENRDKWRRKIG